MNTRGKVDKTIIIDPVRPASGLKRFGEFLLDSPAMVLRFLIYIVGLVPNVAAYVFNALYDFSVTYKREISIALWVGLGIGVAAAIAGLVMAMWFPAALAAVTGVSVFGFSIAMIAGESALLQVLLGTGLALVVADLAAVALATVFIGIKETFEWIKAGFSGDENDNSEIPLSSKPNGSANLYAHNKLQAEATSSQTLDKPTHGKSPISNVSPVKSNDDNENNLSNSII